MTSDGERLERCIAGGGIAVFPADTVYGLACDPDNVDAVERLYALKGRPPDKASALMFFAVSAALDALPAVGQRTREVMRALLPGAVTLLVPPSIGIRVPDVPALAGARRPVLQSSANISGEPDPRRLEDVPEAIRAAADVVIDGGELPGTPSTVVDLRQFEQDGSWAVLRHGAVSEHELRRVLGGEIGFDPDTYAEMVRADIPDFEGFQARVVAQTGAGAGRILELGIGTGETARRLLDCHPDAMLVGIDVSEKMLAAAQAALPQERVRLLLAAFDEPLPDGEFDLVVSVLAIHHVPGPGKADLFRRVRGVLAVGGRFVLGDVVVPRDPAGLRIELTESFDVPSSADEQLRWLRAAGFDASIVWEDRDLAVLVGIVGSG